jgi:hypothetical protein
MTLQRRWKKIKRLLKKNQSKTGRKEKEERRMQEASRWRKITCCR